MATYKIVSDNTSLGEAGKTVTDQDLEGLNVPALIEGGHIEPVLTSFAKRDKKESE